MHTPHDVVQALTQHQPYASTGLFANSVFRNCSLGADFASTRSSSLPVYHTLVNTYLLCTYTALSCLDDALGARRLGADVTERLGSGVHVFTAKMSN